MRAQSTILCMIFLSNLARGGEAPRQGETHLFSVAGRSKYSPLYQSAESGNTKRVLDLLALGAKVNVTGKNGRTPLLAAAVYGYEGIVRLLLGAGAVGAGAVGAGAVGAGAVGAGAVGAGAEVNTADKNGLTPLLAAAAHGVGNHPIPALISPKPD